MSRPGAKSLLHALAIGLALAALAVIAGFVPLSAKPFLGSIVNSVRDASGMVLSVEGPIVVRLGPRAGVRIGGLTLATPDGVALLKLDAAQVRISLLALLRGSVRLREANISGLRIDGCVQLPESPARPPGGEPPDIVIDTLIATEILIDCAGKPADFRIDRLEASAPADSPATVDGTINLAGNTIAVSAMGGILGDILGGSSFPINASIAMDNANLSVEGQIERHSDSFSADASFALNVADSVEFGKAFKLPVPDLGELDVEGRARGDAGGIEIVAANGAVGRTSFSTSGSIDLSSPRLHVDLVASLPLLDIAPYSTGRPSSDAEPIDLAPVFDALSTFDASWKLSADAVTGAPLAIRSVVFEGNLVDGVVETEGANAEILGGQVALEGRLDSRSDCPAFNIDASLAELDLANLRDAGLLTSSLAGEVSRVSAAIHGCGTKPRHYLDTLRANVRIEGGRLLVADKLTVNIASAEAIIDPAERFRANLTGAVAGEAVSASLSAGTIRALLGDTAWPIQFSATGAGSELKIEGSARNTAGGFGFDLTSEFAAPDVGSLQAWVGLAPNAGIPLTATQTLRLDASRLVAENARITLGGSDLTGTATWHHAQSPDTLSLSFRSSFLDLDELERLIPSARSPVEDTVEPPPRKQSLPPIDLDIAIEKIRGGRVDVQDLKIGAHLREGLIEDATVSMIIEDELRLTGELDVDIRQLPAALDFEANADNADLGRLLRRMELVDDLVMRADGMRLEVGAAGSNLQDAVANTSIDADIFGFEWDAKQPASESVFELRFESLQLSMQPKQPFSAMTRGEIDGVPVDLWLQTPSLGTLISDAAELPLRVVAGIGDEVAMLDLTIDRSSSDRLRTRVDLSGQAIDPATRDLASLASPLADYGVKGDLLLDDSGLALSDLEAHVGSSILRGNGSLTNTGRQRLAIELSADSLQSDDLSNLPVFRTPAEAEPEATEEATESAEQNKRGPLVVAHEFITAYQENADLDIGLKVDELWVGEDLLGGAELRLHIDENDFRLEPLKIDLPGGAFAAAYAWEAQGGRVNASLRARVDALAYGGLVRLAEPTSPANGLLYLDVDFNAETAWTTEVSEFELLLRNANGHVELAAWPRSLEADILDLWTTNLIFALVPAPEDGESSRLNCVVVRFEATNGLLKAKTAMLDSTNTVVRGRGHIDLAQGELDLLITPQAKREKFFSASTPVKVTGPLTDFQVGVEPTGFLGTLLKWYTSLIYVPFKWITGQRFPEDGTQTCFDAMDWELTPGLETYFRERDFSKPPLTD